WRRWSADAELSLDGDGGELRKELNLLRERLNAGQWPIRRVDLQGKPTFPPPVQVTLYGHEEIRSRHEEVRDLDAYLITFDERTGPVAELVDRLKKRSGGTQTYRFGPYTRNTRLGLLPPDLPFHEFVERF